MFGQRLYLEIILTGPVKSLDEHTLILYVCTLHENYPYNIQNIIIIFFLYF